MGVLIGNSILAFFQSAFGLLDDLSPELNKMIDASLPALKEASLNRRMRRCKHLCRVNHFTAELIVKQVNVDFQDQSVDMQKTIGELLVAEMGR
jgi:hypothetical protein